MACIRLELAILVESPLTDVTTSLFSFNVGLAILARFSDPPSYFNCPASTTHRKFRDLPSWSEVFLLRCPKDILGYYRILPTAPCNDIKLARLDYHHLRCAHLICVTTGIRTLAVDHSLRSSVTSGLSTTLPDTIKIVGGYNLNGLYTSGITDPRGESSDRCHYTHSG